MGFIRERKIKGGSLRYQAEVRLKGYPMRTAVFNRKNDAKTWIAKIEADIRCGRQQLYAEGRKHTFTEAVERYQKEQSLSLVKQCHLDWWKKELGPLYLQDVRPKAPLCGAKARTRGGAPCLNISMANGRCFLHGGKAPIKHGNRTLKFMRRRKEKMQIKREVRVINALINKML
jgi:hypothetical protein